MSMRLPSFIAIVMAMTVSAAPSAGAQVAAAGAPAKKVELPDTPAGRVAREWLDAFNRADSAALAAWGEKYSLDRPGAAALGMRRQTGGFDLVSVETNEPLLVAYVVRERKSPMTALAVLELKPGDRPVIRTANVLAIPEGASVGSVRIDAATRKRVIDNAIAKLDSNYVFPDVAKKMADGLRARLARGEYERVTNGVSFASLLTEHLQGVSRDKHLRVNFSPGRVPDRRPNATPDSAARERYRKQMATVNCGFVKVEQLPGNVGYVKFNFFADPEVCGPTASAAMSFVANTDALIVDLRENGGGSPDMVAYVTSYLFTNRTHLNDLWTRRTNENREYWTRDVPGARFGDQKPIYVLTSKSTFSGAEEFTYNLKNLKRATIIGETTGGGAHPVSGHKIDEHFVIGVPFARAINPISKTNWEGTGVEPDVKVPASEALDVARRMIEGKKLTP